MLVQDRTRQQAISAAINKVNVARAQLHAAQLEHQHLLLSFGSSLMRMPLTKVLADDCAYHGGPVDAEVERAYRRGFAQGAAQALYAMQDGASHAALARWVNTIWTWREKLRAWSYLAVAKDPPRIPRKK